MTPRKHKALQALLTCRTIGEAARVAEISETTMRAYLKDTEFDAAYRAAFASLVESAMRKAKRTLDPALDALAEIVQNPEENGQTRIAAARTVLEYALRLSERADITERMDTLEAMLKEMEDSKNGR